MLTTALGQAGSVAGAARALGINPSYALKRCRALGVDSAAAHQDAAA